MHFGGWSTGSDGITLELTRSRSTAAPEYKEDTRWSCSARPAACSRCNSTSETTERDVCRPLVEEAERTDRRGQPRSEAAATRWCRWSPERAPKPPIAVAPEACAASTGSSSSSPICRPASAHSSRFTSQRRDGPRSRSAWCCQSAASSALIGQIPGGAIIDAARSERLVAGPRSRPSAAARSATRDADLPRGGRRRNLARDGELRVRGRRVPRSASAWSGRSRSANGSAGMRGLPRSATALRS